MKLRPSISCIVLLRSLDIFQSSALMFVQGRHWASGLIFVDWICGIWSTRVARGSWCSPSFFDVLGPKTVQEFVEVPGISKLLRLPGGFWIREAFTMQWQSGNLWNSNFDRKSCWPKDLHTREKKLLQESNLKMKRFQGLLKSWTKVRLDRSLYYMNIKRNVFWSRSCCSWVRIVDIPCRLVL